MDTRLRKTHKLKVIILTLCVVIPALALTALYPRMERAVNARRAANEEMFGADSQEYEYLTNNFPNYIVEATYCMYADWLASDAADGQKVNFGPLEEYAWMEDYYEVIDNTDYHVEFGDGESNQSSNPELKQVLLLENDREAKAKVMEEMGYLGYMAISYDEHGTAVKIDLFTMEGLEYSGNIRQCVRESQEQYRNNATYYGEAYGETIDPAQVVPKNMKAVFALTGDSVFTWEDGHSYSESTWFLYEKTGAIAFIFVLAVLVALFALLLPFVKKLETGWEKPFSLPAEIMGIIACISICGAILLFEMMGSYVNMYELQRMIPAGEVEIIGFVLSVSEIYNIGRVFSFLGWILVFWMEYMVVASVRQFLSRPKMYLKERLLCVRFVRWILKKARQFWQYMTEVDVSENLHNKLLLLIFTNFVIVGLLCCGWFFGLFGAVVYSAILYYLLRKYIINVQKQYMSVLNAARQIADGNLKVEFEEDLGHFQSLGEELEQVQKGFSKAVMEEAKSQNMKTELITNVSHDLKTPLTAIITYVDLLGKEDLTEEERKSYVATLEKKSQRLKVLIEDLFEVSKATSGNVQLHLMDVDVISLMKQVRTEMEDKIADSDIIFRWNLPEERLVLNLDGQKTYRIFENLLNNILKYAMPQTRAYIDVREIGAEVQIVFRNISSAEIDMDASHLTDRFVRGEASRSSEGSGLGLAIAKSFVELQGGTIQIEVDGDLFKVTIVWKK